MGHLLKIIRIMATHKVSGLVKKNSSILKEREAGQRLLSPPLSVSTRDLEKEETGNRLHIKKTNYYVPEKEKETEILSLVAVPLRLGCFNLV